MRLTFRLALIALLLTAGLAARATLSVTNKTGFAVNWFFHNTDAKYTEHCSLGSNGAGLSSAYFRDYNADGMLDYLVYLKNSKTGGMRLFCLNTNPAAAPAKGERTYAAHRTAWRDIAGAPGSWHYGAYTPISPKMDSPDLVVVSCNRTAQTDFNFSSFSFRRLKKADKLWPDELSATATLPVEAIWSLQWTPVSMNGDDYPDILVHNVQPAANRTYYVRLYDGKTFGLIWAKSFTMDPADAGNVSTPFPCMSFLNVWVLPLLSVPETGRADFDANGKPEIVLWNGFTKMEFNQSTFEMTLKAWANLNLLNSSGNPLAPYTTAWTRVATQTGTSNPPIGIAMSGADFDKDGYRDILMENLYTENTAAPVFEGYSLKKRGSLFRSVASDFGPTVPDVNNYLTLDTDEFARGVPRDVTGDGFTDLMVCRDKGFTSSFGGDPVPIGARIGLFNAKGGAAGRKVWLNTSLLANYDDIHPLANDFNGDNIVDTVATRNPSAPTAPVWNIGNTFFTKSGITLARSFSFTCASMASWNPATDSFFSQALMFGSFGDVDNDGQKDTYGSLAWDLDRANNGSTDEAGASILIYDNPSGGGAPPINARFDVKLTGENAGAWMTLDRALAMNNTAFVDNNKNGKSDDVVAWSDKFVYSLSLTPSGAYPAAAAAAPYAPANGAMHKAKAPLAWKKSEGAIGYDVYIGTSASAVTNATAASAVYRGRVGEPFYLPYPALAAGKTYYWRVDPINAWGRATKGATWSFVTIN